MTELQPQIHFENVTIDFGNTTSINNISFSVYPGDKFLLYGQSGIGKTTIFRLLLGFQKIQQGHVMFTGKPVNEHTVWDIRRQVAYVSQDLDIGNGQVQSMIKAIFSYASTKVHADNYAHLEELLEYLRLPKKVLQEDYERLSGGEKQRIALIVALLLERSIFLLDEATSSLDRELKMKVIRFFIEHPKWTVLSISHDQDWLNNKELNVLKIGT